MKAFACALAVGVALTSMNGCKSGHHHHDRDEGQMEQEIQMEQAPDAVRSTMMRVAGSGKITEVEKAMQSGQTVYKADLMQDGKKWELVVDADGKLISKERDTEDDGEDKHEDRK